MNDHTLRLRVEFDKHLNRICSSLTDLANQFGYRVEERVEFEERIYGLLFDTYYESIEPIFEREERELAFRNSGEAVSENKADDAHDRMWYKRLMDTSKDKLDD